MIRKKPAAKEKQKEESKETSWGAVSDWYDDLLGSAETFQAEVILPHLLRIIEPRTGLQIADVACGQGFFSRAFSTGGASVAACDISKALITLAEKKGGSVKYEVASADHLPWKDGSFDIAALILAIQNIAPLYETMAECARVLKHGGRLIVVLNHPAFRIPKKSSWGFDDVLKIQYRRLDEYASESKAEIKAHPGQQSSAVTISFHRPLQTYFKALHKAGFGVERLEEWISNKKSESGPRKLIEDKARKEIPLFMMLECRVTP